MTYKIARDGQEFGPYSLADVQRYVATGNILLSDFALAEGATEWIPVSQVVGTIAVPPAVPIGYATATMPQFPDPPNLHWALVLLFAVLTCGLFLYAWDIVQALWTKSVHPNTKALAYYLTGLGLLVVSIVLSALRHAEAMGTLLNLSGAVILIVGRFSLRSSLEEHFNGADPIGLSLSAIMTFFFGPLYFQYHFNRINGIKRALRLGNPF